MGAKNQSEWVEVTDSPFGGWVCSKCRYFDWSGKRTPYCPMCGAKMKKPKDYGLEASIRFFKETHKKKGEKPWASKKL